MFMYAKRIRNGINLVSTSFSFMWQHKPLVLYCVIPTFIALIAQIVIYNIVIDPSSIELSFALDDFIQKIMTVPGWLKYLGIVLINITYIALMTTFCVASTYHTMAHITRESVSLHRILVICRSKWRLIAAWSAISAALTSIMQIPALYNFSFGILHYDTGTSLSSIPLTLLILIINLGWMLITYLIVPMFVFEHVTIKQALRLSANVSVRSVYEILGGIFIFTLITMATILPRLILAYIPLPTPLFILVVAALLTADCIISIGIIIFKTMLYNTHYREPMEQLESIRLFPEF
jgi:hypothetical protein